MNKALPVGMRLEDRRGKGTFTINDLENLCEKARINTSLCSRKAHFVAKLKDAEGLVESFKNNPLLLRQHL